MSEPTLAQQLEAAQTAYQQLYNQYQQELAAINTWQARMRAENERMAAELAAINTIAYSGEHAATRIFQIIDLLEGN